MNSFHQTILQSLNIVKQVIIIKLLYLLPFNLFWAPDSTNTPATYFAKFESFDTLKQKHTFIIQYTLYKVAGKNKNK